MSPLYDTPKLGPRPQAADSQGLVFRSRNAQGQDIYVRARARVGRISLASIEANRDRVQRTRIEAQHLAAAARILSASGLR